MKQRESRTSKSYDKKALVCSISSILFPLSSDEIVILLRKETKQKRYESETRTNKGYPLSVINRKLGNADNSFQSIKNHTLAMGDTLTVKPLDDASERGGYKAGFMAAAEVLKARRKLTYVQPHLLVQLYDSAGEIEQALDWLDSSYVYRDHEMVYSGSLPYSEAMRAHPRFKEIVDRMNFPFDYLAPR